MLTDKKVGGKLISELIQLINSFKVAALDESLSELNLIDMMSQTSNSEYVWKTINDFHKDPYTTGFQMFSKMTKVLLSPHEETRPEDEMAQLLQVKMI